MTLPSEVSPSHELTSVLYLTICIVSLHCDSRDGNPHRPRQRHTHRHHREHHAHEYQSCASSAACHCSSSFIHAGIEGAVWSVFPHHQGGASLLFGMPP